MVNNVFDYGPDVNFPGCSADASVTACFLPFIKEQIGSYTIVVDQGFPCRGNVYGELVGPVSWQSAH